MSLKITFSRTAFTLRQIMAYLHMPISVVIITYNEERNIARCLDSVQGISDDVVVVDSFSSDRTAEICRSRGVNFVPCEWKGYAATKNYANSLAKYNLILSLDADEALSETLKQQVMQVKDYATGNYSFKRLTNYCGKWIKHSGWYPDIKHRIFDRRYTRWEGEIHETLVSNSPVKPLLLQGDCLHYSYYSVEEHHRQAEKFAALWAKARAAEGKRSTPLKAAIKGLLKFMRNYLLKLGFLDGYYGFIICRISARETRLKYRLLWQLVPGKE